MTPNNSGMVAYQAGVHSVGVGIVIILLCVTNITSNIYLNYVREIMLFVGKPMGRSILISNATNPLKESRKESLLRCAGSTSIVCGRFVISL